MLYKVGKKGEFASGVVITFQVMAFTGMSPGHPHPVGTLPQGGQEKLGAHATGAGNPDDPDVGRVLHPAYAGQVRCAVAAPIAQKGYCFISPVTSWRMELFGRYRRREKS